MDYQEARKIRIIDSNDTVFTGYEVDETDAEENMDETTKEDVITITTGGTHIEFMQSEIKSIEVLEQ